MYKFEKNWIYLYNSVFINIVITEKQLQLLTVVILLRSSDLTHY